MANSPEPISRLQSDKENPPTIPSIKPTRKPHLGSLDKSKHPSTDHPRGESDQKSNLILKPPLNSTKESSTIDPEHQNHLDTLALLERVERGESIGNHQLQAELSDDPLDTYLL